MCKRHSSDAGFSLNDWKCSRSGKTSWKTALWGDWGRVIALGHVEFPGALLCLQGAGDLWYSQASMPQTNQKPSGIMETPKPLKNIS